ncbi:MAG: hypothetical protein ABIG42_08820, partial [bacterium]
MTNENHEWWNSVNHGGMLISPSRLTQYFPEHAEPMPFYVVERLRRDYTRYERNKTETETALIDTV